MDQHGSSGGGGSMVGMIIYLIFLVVMIAAGWKIFTKAGQPGWAIIVPIYNIITALKIAGKPWYWMFGFFIPVVSIIVAFIVAIDTAKAFGKGAGFGIGMIFLPFIFYPMLGFGDAKYQGTPAS